jgi:hypothetical protein
MTPDESAFLRAQRVVLGVVKARQTDTPYDAGLMINSYLVEETQLGRSIDSAWALLFAAATVWLTAMIESDAVHHEITPAERLTELALTHAVETS